MKAQSKIAEALADLAIGTSLPKGFGNTIDGSDGERTGTNVATWAEWRDFFATLVENLTR